MGKRNTGRKLAMQILYQAELSKHPATKEMRESFFDHHQVVLVETRSWASELVEGVNSHQKECDVVINEAIEIARRYAAMESPKFLNGILGKYVEDRCLPVSSRD